MPNWSDLLQPVPEGLWADEYRSMGGMTFQDMYGMQQEQEAEQARALAAAEAQRQAEAEAARQAAQQQQYEEGLNNFVDWPTYQRIVQDKVQGRAAWEEYAQVALPTQMEKMGYGPDAIREAVQAFAQAVPRPGEDKSFFGNLWESLSSGAQSGTRGMQAYGNIDNVDEIAKLAAAQGGAAGEEVYPLQKFNQALAAIRPGGEDFSKSELWDAIKAYASTTFNNPEGALNWTAQQLAQSYPSLGASLAGMAAGLLGGPVGAVAGGMTGAFTSSSALEAGSQILERVQSLAQERGIDINDAAALTAMLKEPGVYDAIRQAASSKGLAVGTADALVAGMSMGLGALAARSARAGRRLRAGAYAGAGVVGEPIGSAVGEAVSQRVAGDPYSYSDIVGEAFGDVGMGAIHTGAGAVVDRLTARPTSTPTPTPTPTPPEVPEEGALPAAATPPASPANPVLRVAPDGTVFPETLDNVEAYDRARAVQLATAAAKAEAELRDFEQRYAAASIRPTDVLEAEFQPLTADLNDPDSIRQFLAANGAQTRGFTQSVLAQQIIDDLSVTPDAQKREYIADAIEGLESEDAKFAESMAKALLALSKQIPGRAQDVVDAATVQPSLPLVELIRRTTGQRPAAERSAETQAWVDHFLALPRDIEAETVRRENIADEAWQRVQTESRVESMMEAPERRPVDQAALDAAAAQLDRAVVALSSRTPTSREKLQKLRMRAQLLLEETVDDYNRRVGERADAGSGGAGAVAGGGPVVGGGGVGFLTPGGRTSTASAITPLQYRYLNELGGRRDVGVGTSLGERLIADELGMDPENVRLTIAEALAIDLVTREQLNPLQGPRYHATERPLYRNDPFRLAGQREAAAQAQAAREAVGAQRRGQPTQLKRRLRPGELIPTADIVAGFRGLAEVGARAQADQGQSGTGVPTVATQEGANAGLRRGPGSGEGGARSQGSAASQPNAPQGNTGLPGLSRAERYQRWLLRMAGALQAGQKKATKRGRPKKEVTIVPRLVERATPETGVVEGRQYPQEELRSTKSEEVTYRPRNPMRKGGAARIEGLPSDRELEVIEKKEAAAEKRRLKKKREVPKDIKDVFAEVEREYEETYPGRDYTDDEAEIFDPVAEGVDVTQELESPPTAQGLTESAVRVLQQSDAAGVLDYLSAVMASPLARLVAGRLSDLNIDVRIVVDPTMRKPGGYQIVRNSDGTYTHIVRVNPQTASLEVVLHEFVHAATIDALLNPNTDAKRAAVTQLKALYEYTKRALPNIDAYGFKNLAEFVAEVNSSLAFQKELAALKLPGQSRFSVFDAFKQAILRLLGMDKSKSVLSEALLASSEIFSAKQPTTVGEYAAPRPRAVPSSGIIGIKDGQRAFIAYKKRDGDTYTMYPVTAAEPSGVKGAAIPGLSRAEVEQYITDAGATVVAPVADSRPAAGTPKNTSTKLVGFAPDGTLKSIAYEQKDGTWTYYESTKDVRTDPDAKVTKGLSKAAAQRYVTGRGLVPTPPVPGAVRPNASAPTPLGYKPKGWFWYTYQDAEGVLKEIGDRQRQDGTPPDERIDINSAARNNRVQTRIKEMTRQYIEPARKAGEQLTERFGKTQDELMKIVQNLHVSERMDAKIRQVWRGNMLPAQQSQMVAELSFKKRDADRFIQQLNGSNPALLRAIKSELSPKLKALADNTIDLQAQYGLISRESAEQIKKAYDYYVPLQTGDKTSVGKAATGKSVDSDYSFQRMAEQMARTVARGEMNRVRQEVLKLVQGRGLQNLDDPTTPPVIVGPEERVWWDPATNSLNSGVDNHVFSDNSVDAFVDGQRIRMTIADQSLLEALHPYKGEERKTAATVLMALWSRLTHLIAIGKTALSPMFGPFNFVRDVGTAMINMPPGVSRVKVAMALMNPETYASTLYNVGRDALGLDTTGKYGEAATFNSFISQRAYLGLDQMVNDVQTMFAPSLWDQAKDKKENLFKLATFMSQSFETFTRYAVYKAALASGMTKAEAGYAAKTASVNFENRGLKNPSNWWIFGNAKLQGIQALMSTAERWGVAKTAAFTAGLMTLGALAASVGYDRSEKDKDGKSKYAKIPDYKKDSMVLFGEGEVGIPIPQEVAPFYILGNAVQEARMGGTTSGKAASRVFTAFLNNYWPGNVPQQDVTGHKARPMEFLFRALLPSNIAPAVDIVTNRTTFGAPLVSGKEEKLKRGIPLRDMGSPTENQLAVNAAQALGKAGIDVAPQQLRLVHNYFNPAAEGYAFVRDLFGGREPKYEGDIVNPIVRRFTGNATAFYDQDQFDELLAKATQAKYLAENQGINSLSTEQQALARSAEMLSRVERDANALFKGQKLMTSERRQLLNERKKELLLNGIRRYNELRDRMGR